MTATDLLSCHHVGRPIRVGPYKIWAAGMMYMTSEDFMGYDLLVPLTQMEKFPLLAFGQHFNMLAAPLPDFGGVPPEWKSLIETVINELKSGKKILSFCMGSHGRTGCFLASLIAVLESKDEMPDPIAAVRERHCSCSVETLKQAEAIFALREEEVPVIYKNEFAVLKNFTGVSKFKLKSSRKKKKGRAET